TYDVMAPGSMSWNARSLGRMRLPQLLSYPWQLLSQLRADRPDLLIGASDIPHVVLTAWLSRQLGIPYALDLYDNFEGFGQAQIPGAVSALRWAVRHAGATIAVSEPLRNWVQAHYGNVGPVLVMPNAIDKALFKTGSRSLARQRLGLPQNAELVGTAGGLSRSKGVDTLYEAWPLIAAMRPRARLVLAGQMECSLPLPAGDRVHYLGNLPHERVVDLFQALDVGVVTVTDSTFGRYCFPQKAFEMLACGLSVVASDVGVMAELLKEFPALRYQPQNVLGLVQAITYQLDQQVHVPLPIHDWEELVRAIAPTLCALHRASAQINTYRS
ncbi:MAG: glycosyltransferase family 4 protein, partial [Comamonas sp.]|nr:glycosyltransferase family 4 protein [Comamonas sp.]